MHQENDFIGKIQLSDYEEIIFSINLWKSEYGLDIRKYIKLPEYSGPTKHGIRIHKNGLNKIINCLSSLSLDADSIDCSIIGVIPKDCDIDIVVQISDFSGRKKLDIRERINSKKGYFFTKKGLSIPTHKVRDFLTLFEEAKWAFENNYPDL